jgi:hypothetical protein
LRIEHQHQRIGKRIVARTKEINSESTGSKHYQFAKDNEVTGVLSQHAILPKRNAIARLHELRKGYYACSSAQLPHPPPEDVPVPQSDIIEARR